MDLKDSNTKINLMRAFAGESQARNRYTIAAEAAEKQGMHIIKDLFIQLIKKKLMQKYFIEHLRVVTVKMLI